MRRRKPISAGERVELHQPRSSDAEEFCAAVIASKDLHHPWLQAPSDRDSYLAYLERLRRPTCEGFIVRRIDQSPRI